MIGLLPSFIGIGAPKAGTTWLARCLGEHPEVFVAAVKETWFLDYETIDGRQLEYEAHFSGSEGFRARGEFTTGYLSSERPPARIRALVPDARLIVSLRNPVEQVYSHYWHLARQNFHSSDPSDCRLTFEDALEKYENKLMKDPFYYRHLMRWLAFFDRQQFLILLYDDIRDHPLQVLRAVYTFLDVDPEFVPPSASARGADVRQGVSPRGGTLRWMHSWLYRGLNQHIYSPIKRRLGVARAHRIKDSLRVRQFMEHVFFKRGYPPMDSKTRARLARRFANDIRAVESLIGRDLTNWS